MDLGKDFFFGASWSLFWAWRSFFSTFWRFAKIEGRPSISANYLTGELWASSTLLPPLFLMKCIAWFPTPNGSEIQVSYQHSIKCGFKMLFVTEWLTDIFVVSQTISFVLPLFGVTVAPSDWSSTIQLSIHSIFHSKVWQLKNTPKPSALQLKGKIEQQFSHFWHLLPIRWCIILYS